METPTRQLEGKGSAVTNTLEKILEILEDRDKFEITKQLVKKIDPVLLTQNDEEHIPRWYLDLILALSQIYEHGYNDSIKDTQQLK